MSLIRLHEAIAAVCPIVGVALNEDGTHRIDFADGVTEAEIAAATSVLANWQPEPEPKWDEFVANFNYPGNTLYASVVGKVSQAGFAAQDHWGNFKLMMVDSRLRSPQALQASIGYLKLLLEQANQPLSQQDIEAWNNEMESYDFPEICKL
ncbi:MAG: hypothetical protein SFY66_19885 [Oculatellaceae cyanobacterium bins.114]|nr:hypothetical protein [Oculatellaceae cyanobacterium bins.114]